MPEEKSGSTQEAIASQIGSLVDAGKSSAKSPDPGTIAAAADRRASGQPVPPIVLPESVRGGGGKKK